MKLLTERNRLYAVLNREAVDRPPVICPGGMMNAAIVEIMQQTGHILPAAHLDPELMAALAGDVHQATGFENIGVPFCMTVEAEALGSDIKDIYSEAKSAGFDVKIIRQLIRIRKQEPAEVEEQETLLDIYRRALGM